MAEGWGRADPTQNWGAGMASEGPMERGRAGATRGGSENHFRERKEQTPRPEGGVEGKGSASLL